MATWREGEQDRHGGARGQVRVLGAVTAAGTPQRLATSGECSLGISVAGAGPADGQARTRWGDQAGSQARARGREGRAPGFRDLLEGWAPGDGQPRNHNRVHVFVGGDMLVSSSPNDPVFYLNHCNVDRIWAAWLGGDHEPPYLPGADAPAELFRHRIDDPLFAIFTSDDDTRWIPRRMLDVADIYRYDSLEVT